MQRKSTRNTIQHDNRSVNEDSSEFDNGQLNNMSHTKIFNEDTTPQDDIFHSTTTDAEEVGDYEKGSTADVSSVFNQLSDDDRETGNGEDKAVVDQLQKEKEREEKLLSIVQAWAGVAMKKTVAAKRQLCIHQLSGHKSGSGSVSQAKYNTTSGSSSAMEKLCINKMQSNLIVTIKQLKDNSQLQDEVTTFCWLLDGVDGGEKQDEEQPQEYGASGGKMDVLPNILIV